MFSIGQISVRIFAGAAFKVLGFAGWKKQTIKRNLEYVSQGTWMSGEKLEAENLYKKMLRNLTWHVGELLFCFDVYKKLPEDCGAYPFSAGGKIFELAEGAAGTIEKMRRGGIFLTAHYGNYEASGAWLCALGVPLKASFIPLKPKWLNRFVYEKVRCVRGRPYSIDAKNPREFLDQLDGKAPDCGGKKQLFCLLADQDSRIGSAMDGTFLGRPAKINPLPDFLLRHRPNTPVFFCWIQEQGNRKILHAVEAQEPNETQRDMQKEMLKQVQHDVNQHDVNQHNMDQRGLDQRGSKQRDEKISIVDGAYRAWLEERIRENPALWYGWTHRRFRSTRPEIYR